METANQNYGFEYLHARIRKFRTLFITEAALTVKKEDVLKLDSMPILGESYPRGPYRFINREYLVITYETDPEISAPGDIPEPLVPENNTVSFMST